MLESAGYNGYTNIITVQSTRRYDSFKDTKQDNHAEILNQSKF